MGDGIRTRDVQIHSLALYQSELRPPFVATVNDLSVQAALIHAEAGQAEGRCSTMRVGGSPVDTHSLVTFAREKSQPRSTSPSFSVRRWGSLRNPG